MALRLGLAFAASILFLMGGSSAFACLSIDWGNQTFGGTWVNNCPYKVYVVWRDDNCSGTCGDAVGGFSRQSSGLRGSVQWCEAEDPISSDQCNWR